jgi:Flp pilus assembly protein TadG
MICSTNRTAVGRSEIRATAVTTTPRDETEDYAMKTRHSQHGGAMLELALLAPWIFFLFAGALDCGYFCYALISVENAARVAALYASTDTSTGANSTAACTYVLQELRTLPNVGSAVSSCSANPVTVSAQLENGSDGTSASKVSVTYQSLPLVPIPGLLQGRFTWTRSVKMRLRG